MKAIASFSNLGGLVFAVCGESMIVERKPTIVEKKSVEDLAIEKLA